ncbi:MAG: GTPase domain-containing protein [Planctomycetes bacterium]|nr:GTPase domain-containing protein [Planctomycetota bacterium]
MLEYADLLERSRAWIERLAAGGWLSDAHQARFAEVEQRTPGDLFSAGQARPLVVAFFGGTGVGKSSLLNRLAGAPLARVGVQRPTSREVTLYVHESAALATLPGSLVECVRVQRHRDDRRRGVCWVDAPDIDSAELKNRELALAWLPHVDLVVYVVSPERYRDDVGWRIVKQRGHRHGWLFVINRWDEGDARQAEDLKAILRAAGFENPLLFCTNCERGESLPPGPDQFAQVEASIDSLLREHGLRELERLGFAARLADLREAMQEAKRSLGDEATWQNRRAAWPTRWQQTARTIREGLTWPISDAAARIAGRERGSFDRIVAAVQGNSAASTAVAPAETVACDDWTARVRGVWDAWPSGVFSEFIDEIEIELRKEGEHPAHWRATFEAVLADAPQLVAARLEAGLRTALAQPGTRIQRLGRRIAAFLTVMLPGLAMIWVASRVVMGYQQAASSGSYLDTNFAIHSLLLVGLAWVLPLAGERMLRPSLTQTAAAGLLRGLDGALETIGQRLADATRSAAAAALEARAEGDAILHDIAAYERPSGDAVGPTVSRALRKRPERVAARVEPP